MPNIYRLPRMAFWRHVMYVVIDLKETTEGQKKVIIHALEKLGYTEEKYLDHSDLINPITGLGLAVESKLYSKYVHTNLSGLIISGLSLVRKIV